MQPTPITRKDSESSENTLSDEENGSESEEDIVLNGNALSTDSSFSDNNDGYDEENEHTAEQLSTVTRSHRTAILYNQSDYWY